MEPQEPKSFRELVDEHGALVLNVAFQVLRDRAAAEDVTQEVFVGLLRRPMPPGEAGAVRAGIVRRAFRAALDWRKREMRLKRREQRAARLEAVDSSPAEAVEQEEVAAAVETLPEKLRLPIHLHFYHGFAIEEVARALGCHRHTAARRLERGKSALRLRLGAGALAVLAAGATRGGLLAPSAALRERLAMLASRVGTAAGDLEPGVSPVSRAAHPRVLAGLQAAILGKGAAIAVVSLCLFGAGVWIASAPGRKPAAPNVVAGPEGPPPAAVEPPAQTVLPSITPLCGASVTVSIDGYEIASSITDAEGGYRLGGLPAEEAEITLRAEGRLSQHEPVALVAGQTLEVSFAEPPGSIAGRVTRGGDPYPGVGISVAAVDGRRGSASMTSGPDGSFRIAGVPSGTWRLHARGPGSLGFLSGTVDALVEVKDGEARAEIAFPAEAASLAGAVEWEESGAVEWEESRAVEWEESGTVEWGVAGAVAELFRRSPMSDGSVWILRDHWASQGTKNIERGDPTFRFDGLEPGTYAVLASLRDGSSRSGWAGPIEVKEGESVRDVKVTVGSGYPARIAVVDDRTGSPVESISVSLGLESGLPLRLRSQTDAAGWARFAGVPPGAYVLRAESPAHLPSSESVHVENDALERTLRLETASWIVVSVAGAGTGETLGLFATVLSGPDPGWRLSSVEGDHPAETAGADPESVEPIFRLKTRPGRYRIRFAIRTQEMTLKESLFAEERDVEVPPAAEVSVRLDR